MSKRRNRQVSDDDMQLFRDAIGDVRRLPQTPDRPARRPPAPRPRMRDADEAAVTTQLLDMTFDPAALETGEELSFLREGYPSRLLKRLKRGQFSIQAELDLHHMNATAAAASIRDLLDEAHHEGWRCVRIVHGKGLRSRPGGPVLKGLTDRMLRRRDDILAFASARPSQGGTGAVIVLLKR